MSEPKNSPSKYFVIAFLALFFFAGRPVEFGQENSFFHGFLIRNPVIRIGLGVNIDDILIQASSGMKIYEAGSSYRLLAEDVNEIRVRGRREKLTEKFLLLIGQSEKKEEAERLALHLRSKIDQKLYVRPDRKSRSEETFQVLVGDFLTRGEALGFIKKLNEAGIKEAWIVSEEVTEEESHPLWVLVNDELKTLHKDTVIYFVPSHPQSFLSFNGRQYRDIFVLKASPKGLVLVNILNLENYLKGVVPSELSPYHYGAFEALKAQAVAARTYATKNLGLNEDLGFDLCDTPQCQVYGGLRAEHPLSSQAVEATRGEVAVYQGKLINALYTSTCGGMTEDSDKVFEGRFVPYLASTECTLEKQKEWTLAGTPLVPIMMGSRNIEREVASLVSLGIIPPETAPSFYREPAPYEEACLWTQNALDFLGKKKDKFIQGKMTLNFPGLASFLIDAFQWRERVENLMLKSEVNFILKDFPPLREGVRDSLAYLIHTGIYPPDPKLGDESRIVTKGELAYVIYKAIRSHFDPSHKGIFRSLDGNHVEVEEDGQARTLALSGNVILFRSQDGERNPASRLAFLGGEEIVWLERQGEIKLLEVNFPINSNVLDRGSVYNRWQVRLSREELEKRIQDYYPIGRLVDLTVGERGKSRRVTKLQISGMDSQVIVTGLKIRWVLGLKDTLFTIDREHDENGQVTYFTFSGRGWGHGVGLCQVGAFRMAQAGANYRDILSKYYRDIKINKSY
ncbi:MAG: SpoIID/LytB domain-containing protein [Clostridiales bacterium]|nr:SpoIID/LytB domain-containing protein [Clostridiales bacterium]